MTRGNDIHPAAWVGFAVLVVTVPGLAVATYHHGAWWTQYALAAFCAGLILFFLGVVLDGLENNDDETVPDDPTDVLEDGDSE